MVKRPERGISLSPFKKVFPTYFEWFGQTEQIGDGTVMMCDTHRDTGICVWANTDRTSLETPIPLLPPHTQRDTPLPACLQACHSQSLLFEFLNFFSPCYGIFCFLQNRARGWAVAISTGTSKENEHYFCKERQEVFLCRSSAHFKKSFFAEVVLIAEVVKLSYP